MHGKQHLAVIRASGHVLNLETLFFADEVRDPKKTLDDLPGTTGFSKGELAMATQLIEAMTEPWKPGAYRDTYTDRVNELIEAKRQGNEIQRADEAPQSTNVVDLLDALKRSLDTTPAAGTGRGRSSGRATTKSSSAKPPPKKTAAKKAAARKSSGSRTASKAS